MPQVENFKTLKDHLDIIQLERFQNWTIYTSDKRKMHHVATGGPYMKWLSLFQVCINFSTLDLQINHKRLIRGSLTLPTLLLSQGENTQIIHFEKQQGITEMSSHFF